MRKLAILVIATVLAIVCAGADASEKAHRKHAANPPKAKKAMAKSSAIALVLPSVPRDIFVTSGSSR